MLFETNALLSLHLPDLLKKEKKTRQMSQPLNVVAVKQCWSQDGSRTEMLEKFNLAAAGNTFSHDSSISW